MEYPTLSDWLKELERRKEVVEWQISIAKSHDVIREKEIRLKQIEQKITDLKTKIK